MFHIETKYFLWISHNKFHRCIDISKYCQRKIMSTLKVCVWDLPRRELL